MPVIIVIPSSETKQYEAEQLKVYLSGTDHRLWDFYLKRNDLGLEELGMSSGEYLILLQWRTDLDK